MGGVGAGRRGDGDPRRVSPVAEGLPVRGKGLFRTGRASRPLGEMAGGGQEKQRQTVASSGAHPISTSVAAAVSTAPRVVATGPARRIAARPRKLPPPAVSAAATIRASGQERGRFQAFGDGGDGRVDGGDGHPLCGEREGRDLRAPVLETGCPPPPGLERQRTCSVAPSFPVCAGVTGRGAASRMSDVECGAGCENRSRAPKAGSGREGPCRGLWGPAGATGDARCLRWSPRRK